MKESLMLRFLLTPVAFGIVLVVGFRALDARAPSIPAPRPQPIAAAAPVAAPSANAPDAARSGPRNVLVQPALQTGKPLQLPPAVPTIGPQTSAPTVAARPALAPEAQPAMASAEILAPAAEAQPAVAPSGGRGSLGCANYKSYNPQTKTYRGFDGVVKECKSRPEATASN
jgi:hypothetical protein